MNGMRITCIFLLTFIVLASRCKNNSNSGKPLPTSKTINLICDDLYDTLSVIDICDRLASFDTMTHIKSHCLAAFARYLSRVAKIENSLIYGTGGAYYLSDSVIKKDIANWKTKLKCN